MQVRHGKLTEALDDGPHDVRLDDGGPLRTDARSKRGLVLVTGTTGSGKSTTLAAMVRHINETRRCHILTIEDPIEFLHAGIVASVSQRELGIDTRNFKSHCGLRCERIPMSSSSEKCATRSPWTSR